jgi:hypothetical protein
MSCPRSSRKRLSGYFLGLIVLFIAAAGGLAASERYWTPREPPKAHYRIEARIDLEGKTVSGNEEVRFTNSSAAPLEVLAVDWTLSDTRSLELKENGTALTLLSPRGSGAVSSPLLYRLTRPLEPSRDITLEAEFRSTDGPGPDKPEIILQDWFPRLWWDGLPVFDSFEVKFNPLPGYAQAVSGRLNPETGYYENHGVKSFGLYFGRGLETETREVDGVLLTSLHTEKGAACARLCLETAVQAVHFYKEWLGFYPFSFLSIVPGASEPWGGYPLSSGIVVIHGQEKLEAKPLYHWKFITAHEIGHQYWGEFVLDDDDPAWLWIGMGIYADRTFVLATGVGQEAERGMMETYLGGVKKHLDTTIDLPPAQVRKIEFDRNNVVVHGKGFSVVSALETVLGRETFDNIYKACLAEFGGRRLGWHDFQRVAERVSGRSLNWFFEEWVRSNKTLAARVASQECVAGEGDFVSTVVVESLGGLRMPLPVRADFEDGSSQTQTTERLFTTNTLTFRSAARLKEVSLDPDKKLALLETLPPPTADNVADSIAALDWTGVGDRALAVYRQALEADPGTESLWFKLGMTLYDGSFYPEAFDAFQHCRAENPEGVRLFAVLVWMGQMQDLLGNRKEALKYYREALSHDVGKTMRHDQYGMKIDRAWVEALLKTPFTRGAKK